MVCRHAPGDPSCSSHPNYVDPYDSIRRDNERKEQAQLVAENIRLQKIIDSPNASEYDILDVHQVGYHMVLKVRYPSCEKCSYEGIKIMVFKNCSPVDALKWNKIDPHFSDPEEVREFGKEAPSPAARFPANDAGWIHAIKFAEWLT